MHFYDVPDNFIRIPTWEKIVGDRVNKNRVANVELGRGTPLRIPSYIFYGRPVEAKEESSNTHTHTQTRLDVTIET